MVDANCKRTLHPPTNSQFSDRTRLARQVFSVAMVPRPGGMPCGSIDSATDAKHTRMRAATMTMSIRRMSLGAGYRYLMSSVARAKRSGHAASALTGPREWWCVRIQDNVTYVLHVSRGGQRELGG